MCETAPFPPPTYLISRLVNGFTDSDVVVVIQVRRAIYDKGVDFWMLGILIYELLHGRTPFEAETEMNTFVYWP